MIQLSFSFRLPTNSIEAVRTFKGRSGGPWLC
jgi:hypothetical protein